MKNLEVPDKGYAWVIVFCAAVINTIVSGLSRMVGLLYVAILEEYAVPRREASLPFTVRNAIRHLTGPLVGVLGQKYGIRSVTFVGGLIAAAGSIFSAFAPSVTWIVILWGGIHGIGFSMSNTLFQVVVNQYFEHHRATASGIVLSGACLGSLFYPFMIGAMLDAYGLFGCFLLLGGLFLNILPPSLGLKPPIWVRDPEGYARKRANGSAAVRMRIVKHASAQLIPLQCLSTDHL
ncbi:monocarboxylate transporter 9-like [Uloborus diversus]|uniref:monocarboxylate transporter 9-like n=1 Tax=Uloborus diversus TaxID=327109 RepID=UPI00240A0C77|nr:monocarboxylate transporter 9-like [Uloborus diversus]